MNFSEEVKTGLWAMIDEMSNDTTPFTMHPGKDFSRKKKWDFPKRTKFLFSCRILHFVPIFILLVRYALTTFPLYQPKTLPCVRECQGRV